MRQQLESHRVQLQIVLGIVLATLQVAADCQDCPSRIVTKPLVAASTGADAEAADAGITAPPELGVRSAEERAELCTEGAVIRCEVRMLAHDESPAVACTYEGDCGGAR